MKTVRPDVSALMCLSTAVFSAVSLSVLVVLGQPLLVYMEGGDRALIVLAAALSAAFMTATVAIGAFWILPKMRRQSKEQGKLQTLTGALERRSQDLETAALTDALTGMHNRRFFDEAMRYYLDEFEKIGRPLGFMLLDLDHFKAINDTHGHDVGDEVLKAVANCLFEVTRHHDIVARLGGEEFAVVTPNMGRTDCEAFADRIREAIGKLVIRTGNVHLRVTVSIGVAVSQRKDDVGQFYKRADVNLYHAKQTGRNRVCA
ncbi:GGDEF domain-containing protein [Fulvimarina sp. 2208YS6-2-32]|uniref:diguanylate cyclase n=2 Tax=Fulvimarina uroteuthidis TaxID=3098149 RepID=A0ABU5I2W4_9HYPH|nr:GGDEF domain-containing protein [Fulvimarina sp. 2208YS6-2-32]